ncbi:glycosyltransferase family 39 protein [Edaphobacter sp. DSM 109919]|uniref:Glycosyltransferase family 39 protein n=1 Tax=Edaphobacter paludis TaxID=3035702 RepID=A0AAU7CZX0_9BACT
MLNNPLVRSFRQKSTSTQLSIIVLAALTLRLILVACIFRQTVDPTDHFDEFGWEMGWVARSIAQGHGFSSPFWPSTGPTALVPPIFPYFVATIFRIFGVYTAASAIAILSINSLFSALTCIPLYFSTRYAIGDRAATLAAWAWVFYPFAIYFSAARVWDYALTGLLFTTCFCLAQRLHRQRRVLAWLGFGVFYGIAGLSNPSVLSMFPVFLILTAVVLHRRKEKWLAHSLVATLGVLAVLTPWTVRNYRALHMLTPVRDNFWLECWAGNDGSTFESNDRWAHPASNPTEMQRFESLGEARYLAEKHTLAVTFIRQHPVVFLKNSFRRALCFWTAYWSFSRAYLADQPTQIPDMFFSIGLTIFMLVGARKLWLRDKTAALPYVILMALFPFTYFFTHASPDYRQPIEPEIIALVSTGILSLKRFNRPALKANQQPRDEDSQTVFIPA